MTIHSQAQHDMLTKAAADPAYAAQRGISQDAAKTMLDQHQATGAPKLPDRAVRPEPPATAPKSAKSPKPSWWRK